MFSNYLKFVFILYVVVNRVIEQYPALKKLFTEDIPKHYPKVYDAPRVQRIYIEAIRNKYTLPILYLMEFTLDFFFK